MDHDDAVAEVVLSEERARVETRKVPVERVRIRKRIVTQSRTVTVQERREELTIERVPLSEDASALDTADEAREEVVLMLRQEVAEVVTRVVPVERVRIRRETVTETATVDTEVRREQAAVHTDPGHP